ncbi:MauE/DoxX family redox-associated membrane protein [Flavobacterium aquiphilum]|uniref:MauE/DoxX family redox-associated membrane protein n=1 Tax=Flavobacterium aquiphilum TaxID=3003261 RepID=UPI0024817AD2|nr:MauE/DoxX family redox-associated membrane protein [Flavobacterium aquiphilum]
MKRSIYLHYFITSVCYLHVLVFTYAAASKLFDYQNFQIQLSQSPLISAFVVYVSWSVPLLELLISALLIFPKTRTIGLYACYFFMVMFTAYIFIILNYSSFVPCSCGGILEKMNWTEHLIFNSVLVILALIALYLGIPESAENGRRTKIIRFGSLSLIITMLGVGIVIILFLLSENIVHYHNTLVRRFPHTPIEKKMNLDLGVNSYYIAGVGQNAIYLGNTTAPLLITVVNDKMEIIERKRIELNQYNFVFHGLRINVKPPYFFVTDGTVPVIYKGIISNWKARVVKQGGEYFAAAEAMDSVSLVLRTHSSITGESILGTINTTTDKTSLNPQLLVKQFDGVFDLDGQLHYNEELRQVIYLYAYRNQYTQADLNLKLLKRGKTIDTISKAKLEVVKVKNNHVRKLAKPPLFVNKSSATSGHILFVNSAVPGKYEKDALWKSASIIDVYNLKDNSYLYTFCIYDIAGRKMRSFIINGDNLYALIGSYLFHSKLNRKRMKQYEQ